jgi:hypothetical protein
MENLPLIFQIAAWVYVLKHVLVPFLILLSLPLSYLGLLWINHGDREKTNREFVDSVLQGVSDSLSK